MPPSRKEPVAAKPARSGGSPKAAAPRRRRLARDEREQIIVREAIRFFAEVGFEGQTRELARRIGITQPLIFRYFPTKDDLIERVYQEVYVSRFSPEWQRTLEDRGRPLADRLIAFYKDYTRAIFSYEWVRIFMYSGLKGVNINRRYLALVHERILAPLCRELRVHCGYPEDGASPVSEEEMEFAWGLHGSIFYLAVRKWIYGVETPRDLDAVIANKITAFMEGGPLLLRRLFGPAPAKPAKDVAPVAVRATRRKKVALRAAAD